MKAPNSEPRYIDALADLGTVRAYPKNTILVHEGDKSDQLYVVLSGKLKVFLSDGEGREITIDILGPDQYFGEMALEGEPRSASIMTTEASRLSVLERSQFRQFFATNPEAAYWLYLALVRRARNLTKSVGGLALLDVYGRVARLLLDNASEESGCLVVGERITQQEIAKRVGASRETVSRILTDLREGNYITIENDRIKIQQHLPKRW
ncbi:MAG TPA: cyclic nucleotide-binding domain-containing protein [Burkholderiales bacterium]|nr:cyclic nucleotide-binding domain-containing protein [Burkholderiales bacterium]